jgi:uncharacterized protein YegL
MPKLMNSDTDTALVPGTSMQFSFTRPNDLEATEYTLATIVVDVTGSVHGFSKELLEAVKSIVRACRKSPRADNLLIRLVTFSTKITEIHGFIPLSSVNEDDYEELTCDGLTALYDATYECIGATLVYAKTLVDMDFDVNGITFVITDGYDNASKQSSPNSVRTLVESARSKEDIESLITVLIGINSGDASYYAHLQNFKDEAQLNQFVDAGEATPGKLAKLAQFVSQSISSQSKALGTGGPSVPLTF